MQTKLQIGQTLYAKNGDKVVVEAISGQSLTVAYNNRRYTRDMNAVGKTLFTSNPLEQAAAEVYEGDESFLQESHHLRETQTQLETFNGFVLAIDIGLFGNVIGTRIGFDEVTKEELIRSPYFARMDIDIDDHSANALEVAYIGKKGVYHEDRLLISDWRSEIGQKYYMKNVTKFEHNGFDYELLLRRALRIRNSTLTGYENEFAKGVYARALRQDEPDAVIQTDKITDPFLQDIIRQKHYQNKLTDIIESIQENQNAIITYDENASVVVQGCAGSGKTMILLHRLSFIKYRNRNLDLSKIKILTPNSLFSMYINDLSTSLELEKIERLTVNEYYVELLSRYYSVERMQLKNRCSPAELKEFRETLLAQEKAAAGWPEIYTEDLWALIRDATSGALRDVLENHINIRALAKIFKEKYSIDADTFSIRSIADLRLTLNTVKASFEPYYRQLKVTIESETALSSAEREFLEMKASLPGADAVLDRLAQETASQGSGLRSAYEQRRTDLSTRLKSRQAELKRLGADALRRKQLTQQITALLGEIYECDFCLRALKYQRLKHVLEIDRKHLGEESARLSFSDEAMVLIENAYAHANSFSVAIIEKVVMDAVKRSHGAALSFRNKIYIRLLTNYFLFGPLNNTERLLCIDEGHDLSVNEYRLLSAISGGSLRFNIYGDVNQLVTSGEGVSDWQDLKDIFDYTYFTLNENYRNSAEIIEYYNDALGLETTNLGVGGDPVQALDVDGFIEHANNNIIGTRKLAVIVKKKTPALLALLRERLVDKINPDEINPGEIAVLTPKEAKGLEFDTCYVMPKGMNRNEKYIAFTRALNELYVVS